MRSEVPEITVITATLNAASTLPRLISSLEKQSNQGFDWVVIDGGSNDGTSDLVRAASIQGSVVFHSEPDEGIYDALNRGVRKSQSEFYLIVGADDSLDQDAIANFRQVLARSEPDLVAARVTINGKPGPERVRGEWLHGQFAYVSSHAVGLLIRRSIHDRVGPYSTDLKIAADQEFVIKCVRIGADIAKVSFVAGEFCTTGTSGRRVALALTENFRVMVRMGHNVPLQALLLALRLVRHRRRISEERWNPPSRKDVVRA